MNEELLKAELLKKDKEQIIELYLQKCYDTNVEIEQLKAENERLKNNYVGSLQKDKKLDDNNDLYIIGEKLENSNEFNTIFQNIVYSYEQAKEIVKKYNLDLKIYKIVDLIEV